MTGAEIAIIGLTAAGVGVSAYSMYQTGQAQARQAKAQSAWADYNAKVAQREADAERKAAAFEAEQQKRQGKMLLARQRAMVGAKGVEFEGSPLLVAEDTAAQLAIENANIRTTGQRRVMAYESQSILDTMQAGMYRSSAKDYARAGTIGAGASILQGAGNIGYMGYDMGLWGTKTPKKNVTKSYLI
jgi:hypothetical protein